MALVGETGAGKSTLVKLVARFYDPTAGSGRWSTARTCANSTWPATGTSWASCRRSPTCSPARSRDAIAYGRPDATDAEVEAAARAVGAHEMIAALPGGYRPPGRRARPQPVRGPAAADRAGPGELVDPAILLLDEATAALDLATEAAVTRATARLTAQRTTLVVAHRLTTAARADRIIVLEHGRIVEDGTHEELLGPTGCTRACGRPLSATPSLPPDVRPHGRTGRTDRTARSLRYLTRGPAYLAPGRAVRRAAARCAADQVRHRAPAGPPGRTSGRRLPGGGGVVGPHGAHVARDEREGGRHQNQRRGPVLGGRHPAPRPRSAGEHSADRHRHHRTKRVVGRDPGQPLRRDVPGQRHGPLHHHDLHGDAQDEGGQADRRQRPEHASASGEIAMAPRSRR